MARVFLSLGSNLGDRRGFLEQALRLLGDHEAVRVITCSQVYETEPWPEVRVERARWYLNCAVEIETELPPYRLLQVVQEIEQAAGRPGPARWTGEYADRTLDVDILLYEDRVLSDDELQIPHPLLLKLESLESDSESVQKAGVQYAIEQCQDLLKNQADGLHFYTLNKSKATVEIVKALNVKHAV